METEVLPAGKFEYDDKQNIVVEQRFSEAQTLVHQGLTNMIEVGFVINERVIPLVVGYHPDSAAPLMLTPSATMSGGGGLPRNRHRQAPASPIRIPHLHHKTKREYASRRRPTNSRMVLVS